MKETLYFYNSNSKKLTERYEKADVSEVQKLLLQTFEKNSNLLEIGCGSGRDASFMTRNDFNIIAIDGSKNMIEEAKKIHPELSNNLFHKTLPNNLEFDKKFDGIYSIATLMHLSKIDLEETILKIHDLLNSNGKFLMSVSLFRDDIDEHGFDDRGRYFLIMSLDEWINLLEKIGFKILEAKTNSDGLSRDGIKWLTLVGQK
ncbi:class I SAM-dependent methyltransferase [Halarcobacter anaerophilus]|jgi:cyclopropane fatty-acyl-phospholipid synthase-like methyltransferase|uniref:class I SAM-dependent methyltransferase n=1 Tax=Halarcobacter anaerophilus TaxID=877500 RepID=UPI0005C879D0|nr:class I SAM-dependent methyltransferase [Halarcobacter anaerophilus]